MGSPQSTGSGPPGAQVTPARPEHLESLVDCHLAALPGDFIPRLGRALVRDHDRFYMEQPDGIVRVSLDPASGRVAGFILGGSPEVRSRFVRRHALGFLTRVVARSFTDSFVRRHALELIAERVAGVARRVRRAPPAGDSIPDEPPGTWGVSIALGTHPDFRGEGAGRAVALLEAMHAACGRLGYSTTRAMTSTENTVSHLLHTRLGWKLIGTRGGYHYYRRAVEAPTAPAEDRR